MNTFAHNFLSLPICLYHILSLAATWSVQEKKGIFWSAHLTATVQKHVIFLVQDWGLKACN